ncbi:MAG TPA: polysaccharide deacetylase family protein [Bryobacteraceae bacterium]|nr:polysaccharide deacetylase family protein [Bryobacteraceae bacterium]
MDRSTSSGKAAAQMVKAVTVPELALALMYHEVMDAGPPAGVDLYKIGRAEFVRHVEAIRDALAGAPVGRVDHPSTWTGPRPVFLTFDDGHASDYHIAARLLETLGWRGHFFVVTDFIGRPGFLTAAEIRELAQRGHAIGSHTCSHPVPISLCDDARLAREWNESTRLLARITGEAILTASIPGGYYSRRVAGAAEAAGIRFLFTSEPRASTDRYGECLLIGRYAIRRSTGPEKAAAIAAGRIAPRWREAALWNAKKVLKRANARAYVRARRMILGY